MRVPLRAVSRRTSAVLCSTAFALVAVLLTGVSSGQAQIQPQTQPQASPLLWGDNIGLYPGGDKFLTDSAIPSGLLNAHATIIRLPIRGATPSTKNIANWSEVQQAALDVKAMGLAPLVILRNPQDPTLAADDAQAVNYMSSVFNGPNDIVYYEWANETDLTSSDGYVPVSTYVASWNANVPTLKALAGPRARFIGPVNYQYDPSYLTTFLQSANPRPDAISWHEYTCANEDQQPTCLSKIDRWTSHIADARSIMDATLGTELPIWITEWNFNARMTGANTPSHNDFKGSDTGFMTQWTTKALQVLAANGVAASMHFDVDSQVPLVNDSGTLAPEGDAFKAQYEALVGPPAPTTSPSNTPTTSPSDTPTETPTGTPSDTPTDTPSASASDTPPPTTTTAPAAGTLRYSFEDNGLDGWSSSGNITKLANSNDVGGHDGGCSLEVDFTSKSATDQPYLHVNPSGGPSAGTPVTAYVWAAGPGIGAKLYVQDPQYNWHQAPALTQLTTGHWTALTFTPSGYTGSAVQVGLQVQESPANQAAKIYLDGVRW